MGEAMQRQEGLQRQQDFFARLADAPSSLLLLDYDGTLAPFTVERMQARPYPGVIERLERIQRIPGSGFVVVTGRPVTEAAKLLQPLDGFTIRGAHGLELRTPDGAIGRTELAEADARALNTAQKQLEDLGLTSAMEQKAGGIALHWREYAAQAADQLRALALRQWTPLIAGTSLRILPFDGGLELRVTRPHKGDAVQAILDALPTDTCTAYLGDDATDEDAFLALGQSGLSVLVREDQRPSAAQLWLRPPGELLAFLDGWIAATHRT